MKQAHVFISGFVQGVGFRQFVKHNAEKLGIVGLVKNVPASPVGGQGGHDGRVEIVFQVPNAKSGQTFGDQEGAKETVDRMLALCRKGPFLSEVEGVEVMWEEITQTYTDFAIVL